MAGCPQTKPTRSIERRDSTIGDFAPMGLKGSAHLKMPMHESTNRVVGHCSKGENNIEPHREFCIFKDVIDLGQRCNKLPTELSVKV